MSTRYIENARRRLMSSISWDSHGESTRSDCLDICERLNAYLQVNGIEVQVTPLEIHNWLGENGVQDPIKYAKIENLVKIVVGDSVAKSSSREEILAAFYRMIGHTTGQP